MEQLAFAAEKADAAAADQILIRKEWQDHAQPTDRRRRVRIWQEAHKRLDNMGFVRPLPPTGSPVLQRAFRAQIRVQCTELVQLDTNLQDIDTFMATLREGQASMTLDLRAIMRWAAPGVWNSARSSFLPGKTVTKGQRASMVKMAKALLAAPVMRHEMYCMMEILDGPGSLADKWASIESAEWEPEAEDVLQCVGIWHNKSHRILREKVGADTVQELKKELARRSKPKYILPETIDGTGELLTEDAQWQRVFTEQMSEHCLNPEARQQARLMLGKARPLTAEQHKDIRTVMRGTDLHENVKNSAFCRMMMGRTPLSPSLEWPDDFTEYDYVNMEVNGVHHTVQPAALQTVLEEQMRGEGKERDKQASKVRVQDLRMLSGPKAAAACEDGVPVLGRTAVFKATWCEGTRQLLTGERKVKVGPGDKGVSFGVKLPREQMLTLDRSTTAVFLAACKARGLTEEEAILLLAYSLSEQLSGITSVVLKTCQMEMGKPPHSFWNWWSPSTEVQVYFSSREALQRAVIEVSRGKTDLYMFDGASVERSVLALRAYVLQNKALQLEPEEESEVLYAGVHAANRARHHFCLHVSGFNHLTYMGVKGEYGHTCASAPNLLETRLEGKLRALVPDLREHTVELIRRDTAQEEASADAKLAAGGRPARIEGQSLGGGGPRAWFWKMGMRIFCTKDQAPVVEPALRMCLDDNGDIFMLFPNQPPGSLKVTRMNEKKPPWTGAPAAKGKAKEVTEEEFDMLTLDEYAEFLEVKLEECKRMTLPADGQLLEEQQMEQDVEWPTLRNVLRKHLPLPHKVTWKDVVEHFINKCGMVERVELQEDSDDNRLLEHFDVDELTGTQRAKAWEAGRVRRDAAAVTSSATNEGGDRTRPAPAGAELGAGNRSALNDTSVHNPPPGLPLDGEGDETMEQTRGGGAETSRASEESMLEETLNNSMEVAVVAEEEDRDIMQVQLQQAQELTRQQQARRRLEQGQHEQIRQLRDSHAAALGQVPVEQQQQMQPMQQEELANLMTAHSLQQREMLQQQEVQQIEHEEVLEALRASHPTSRASLAEGGSGAQ